MMKSIFFWGESPIIHYHFSVKPKFKRGKEMSLILKLLGQSRRLSFDQSSWFCF